MLNKNKRVDDSRVIQKLDYVFSIDISNKNNEINKIFDETNQLRKKRCSKLVWNLHSHIRKLGNIFINLVLQLEFLLLYKTPISA